MRIFWNEQYTSSGYEFDTTRKSDWIVKRVRDERDDNYTIVDPAKHYGTAVDYIRRLHTHEYVDAMWTGEPRPLAQSNGFDWDGNAYMSAIAHTSGVIAAVDAAMTDGFSGTLSSGLHHARTDRGNGFCTFNGLAVAAQYAFDRYGEEPVILDLDAHAGGGTVEMLTHNSITAKHLDVTVSQFDTYDFTPFGGVNIVLNSLGPQSATDEQYLKAVRYALSCIPADSLVIYNAGMDPVPDISRTAIARRESMVAQHLWDYGCRAAFTLAGGYTWSQTQQELVDLHMLTVDQFADKAQNHEAAETLGYYDHPVDTEATR